LYKALETACTAYASLNLSLLHYIGFTVSAMYDIAMEL